MSIRPDQQEALIAMGVALQITQNAERVIRLCMTIVIPKDAPLTLESLQKQEEAERTKTIGHFLSELRKRATVDESFDSLLKNFLTNRNDFVHDLSRVPCWGLNTSEESAASMRFLNTFIDQTEEVLRVFVGLVLAWQEQGELSEPKLPEHEWFGEVAAIYKPLANQVFRGKGV